MNPKIELKGVTKLYATRGTSLEVLRDFDLTIAHQEFLAVVGPTGCGKTTLLNLIAGLEFPDRGLVAVDGQPVKGPGPERGVVFQQYALFPWLTVAENVAYGLKLRRVPRDQRMEVVRHYLALVHLTEFAGAYPRELSGGMKQRTALARAYATHPEVLLMDEPFGALDALTRRHLHVDLTRAWQEEQTMVFFITHDVEEAIFLAQRVLVLTQRPARVARDLTVPFPYPRTPDIYLDPRFSELRAELWHLLDDSTEGGGSTPRAPAAFPLEPPERSE